MVCRDWCGRTRLVCTKPWPQPHRTPLGWIGMPTEPGLAAQNQYPTSRMHVAEWKQDPTAMFQHLVESLPSRVEAVRKGGDQLHINAHDFGMRCSTSRCPYTFGHVLYMGYTIILRIVIGNGPTNMINNHNSIHSFIQGISHVKESHDSWRKPEVLVSFYKGRITGITMATASRNNKKHNIYILQLKWENKEKE